MPWSRPAGGWWAGSLALLSDAGHMVTDVAALAIALFAQHLAERPPSRRASYGYARAEVLAAFSNALIMLAVVGLDCRRGGAAAVVARAGRGRDR